MLRHAGIAAGDVLARNAARATGARSVSMLTQILDGSVWQLKSRKGKLVGEDEFGNKYFENTAYQSGRHRWVEYADLDNQYPYYNASTVPPEWHGWLSHVDDEPGLATRPVPPNAIKFIAGGHTTGVQGEMYQPKGSFYNKRGMRNWKRYTPWSPP